MSAENLVARAVLSLIWLLATCSAVGGQTPPIQVVAGSVRNQSHPALQDGRASKLESRSFQVLAVDSWEQIAVYDVVMFRDPSSGLFVSQIALLQHRSAYGRSGDLLANTVVGIDGPTIRAFSYIRYTLSVRESTARFSTMEQGQSRALAELSRFSKSVDWPDGGQFGSGPEYRISLWKRLPVAFTRRSNESMHPPTRLHDLTRTYRCWGMVLDVPGGNSTPIIVDERFDLSTPERCKQPPQNSPNVRLVAGSALTDSVAAWRNGKLTTISSYYAEAEVVYPHDQIERLRLFMLYDPDSRLFWWTVYQMHPDPSERGHARLPREWRDQFIYLTDERIAVFSAEPSTTIVRDSGDHYPSVKAGEDQVLRALESMPGRMQLEGRFFLYHRVDWSGHVPRDFFALCGDARLTGPRLSRVTRSNRQWELTLTGPNGNKNSATVSLNDAYETLDARLSPPKPPATIDRVIRSGKISVLGNRPARTLEMRELEISHPGYCRERASTRVMMFYDAASHLMWWTVLSSDGRVFNPAVYETEDKIVVFSAVDRGLEARESATRYSSLDEARAHILRQLWRGNVVRHFSVDLTKALPREPPRPPARPAPAVALRISRTNDLWRIVVPRANGATALVVLDAQYRLISAVAQR